MTDAEGARCPQCAGPMREVSARARTGYMILLDQCETCGGVWCDRWELFPLAPDEALRLDPVDEGRLQAIAPPPQETARCPRCTAELRRFRDAALPPDARVLRCRVCDGIWLNRGALGRWRGGEARKPTGSPAALEELMAAVGAEAKWATVADLDGATRSVPEPAVSGQDTRAAIGAGAAWVVLRLLLRLLLRV